MVVINRFTDMLGSCAIVMAIDQLAGAPEIVVI